MLKAQRLRNIKEIAKMFVYSPIRMEFDLIQSSNAPTALNFPFRAIHSRTAKKKRYIERVRCQCNRNKFVITNQLVSTIRTFHNV